MEGKWLFNIVQGRPLVGQRSLVATATTYRADDCQNYEIHLQSAVRYIDLHIDRSYFR